MLTPFIELVSQNFSPFPHKKTDLQVLAYKSILANFYIVVNILFQKSGISKYTLQYNSFRFRYNP